MSGGHETPDGAFDYVVVGAGTGGCVVASRLAEDPAVRVALIEAGPDHTHPFIHIPATVGAAIATGYQRALAAGADLLVVMAGDDQMDPADLPSLLEPVWRGGADYAKGNRFRHPAARQMPVLRRLGSSVLSVLTRWATALDVDDCQCGYTVLSAHAARRLPLSQLCPRYGYPNDLLGMLAAAGCRVVEAPVRPVYADERSGLRPYHVLVVSGVIARRWWHTRRSAFVPELACRRPEP